MTTPLYGPVARLRNARSAVVGTGFLVTPRHVLTCAHVVNDAIGRRPMSVERPSETVTINLGFPLESAHPATGRVIGWYPPLEGEALEVQPVADIAILQLDADAPVAPFQLIPLPEDTTALAGFGFPEGYDTGLPLEARTIGAVAGGWIALVDIKQPGVFVRGGYSGGPLLVSDARRVAGMLVAAGPEADRRAFMIPSDLLQRAWPPLARPYRGLGVFEEDHSRFFFGRSKFTQDLTQAILEQVHGGGGLHALIGASGCGKSSVLRAGVLPALRAYDVAILLARPGHPNPRNPFANLAAQFALLEARTASVTERLALADRYETKWNADPIAMVGDLVRVAQQCALVLMLDQFEEVFAPDADACRDRFIQVILDACRRVSGITALIVVRSDFYKRLHEHALLHPALPNRAESTLGPMTVADLDEAVRKPAAVLGVTFEDGLASEIVHEAAQRTDPLPHLQQALTALWERMEGGQDRWMLTRYGLRGATGGTDDGAPLTVKQALNVALTRHADAVLERLRVNGLEAEARSCLLALVNVAEDETTGDTRRTARLEEFLPPGQAVLHRLAGTDARLVVLRDDTSAGQVTVELVHETLLRDWGVLRGWIEDDRDFRRWRQETGRIARRWQRSAADDDLLRGRRLRDAEEWLTRRSGDLKDDTAQAIRTLVAKSERQAQTELDNERALRGAAERAAKRLRWLSGILAVVTLVAVISFGVAEYFSGVARQKEIEAEGARDREARELAQAEAGLIWAQLSLDGSELQPQEVSALWRLAMSPAPVKEAFIAQTKGDPALVRRLGNSPGAVFRAIGPKSASIGATQLTEAILRQLDQASDQDELKTLVFAIEALGRWVTSDQRSLVLQAVSKHFTAGKTPWQLSALSAMVTTMKPEAARLQDTSVTDVILAAMKESSNAPDIDKLAKALSETDGLLDTANVDLALKSIFGVASSGNISFLDPCLEALKVLAPHLNTDQALLATDALFNEVKTYWNYSEVTDKIVAAFAAIVPRLHKKDAAALLQKATSIIASETPALLDNTIHIDHSFPDRNLIVVAGNLVRLTGTTDTTIADHIFQVLTIAIGSTSDGWLLSSLNGGVLKLVPLLSPAQARLGYDLILRTAHYARGDGEWRTVHGDTVKALAEKLTSADVVTEYDRLLKAPSYLERSEYSAFIETAPQLADRLDPNQSSAVLKKLLRLRQDFADTAAAGEFVSALQPIIEKASETDVQANVFPIIFADLQKSLPRVIWFQRDFDARIYLRLALCLELVPKLSGDQNVSLLELFRNVPVAYFAGDELYVHGIRPLRDDQVGDILDYWLGVIGASPKPSSLSNASDSYPITRVAEILGVTPSKITDAKFEAAIEKIIRWSTESQVGQDQGIMEAIGTWGQEVVKRLTPTQAYQLLDSGLKAVESSPANYDTARAFVPMTKALASVLDPPKALDLLNRAVTDVELFSIQDPRADQNEDATLHRIRYLGGVPVILATQLDGKSASLALSSLAKSSRHEPYHDDKRLLFQPRSEARKALSVIADAVAKQLDPPGAQSAAHEIIEILTYTKDPGQILIFSSMLTGLLSRLNSSDLHEARSTFFCLLADAMSGDTAEVIVQSLLESIPPGQPSELVQTIARGLVYPASGLENSDTPMTPQPKPTQLLIDGLNAAWPQSGEPAKVTVGDILQSLTVAYPEIHAMDSPVRPSCLQGT